MPAFDDPRAATERPTPSYTIEHRTADDVVVLAVGIQQLAPIADYLESQGKTGDLVVVDETGHLMIWWPLGPADDVVLGDSG